MESSLNHAAQVIEDSKRLARHVLALGENRIELLSVEAQEQCERLLQAFGLVLAVAAFGILSGIALTAAVAILLWPLSPVVALLILTVICGATALYFLWRLNRLLRRWQIFSETRDQLRKDRTCLARFLA